MILCMLDSKCLALRVGFLSTRDSVIFMVWYNILAMCGKFLRVKFCLRELNDVLFQPSRKVKNGLTRDPRNANLPDILAFFSSRI